MQAADFGARADPDVFKSAANTSRSDDALPVGRESIPRCAGQQTRLSARLLNMASARSRVERRRLLNADGAPFLIKEPIIHRVLRTYRKTPSFLWSVPCPLSEVRSQLRLLQGDPDVRTEGASWPSPVFAAICRNSSKRKIDRISPPGFFLPALSTIYNLCPLLARHFGP